MALVVRKPRANAGDVSNVGLIWGVGGGGGGQIPWRRAWKPTLVFLPEGSHGQRSLAGYSPRGHKELDTT